MVPLPQVQGMNLSLIHIYLSNVLRDTTKVADLQIKPGKKSFKGCYLEPERDATDERNQKELDFSLEEAKVIANLKPHLLSLRELYMVALSYKDEPEKFYKIIAVSYTHLNLLLPDHIA